MQHTQKDILRESMDHETETLSIYYSLLELVQDKSVVLEEYAREMIHAEELHVDEVNKMLRNPGDIKPFEAN